MKIVLAYTPFAWPSAPPLGISLLKSCVESGRPGTAVECMDLNLDYFLHPEKFSGLCGCCPRGGWCSRVSPGAFLAGDSYEHARLLLSTDAPGFYNPRLHTEAYLFFRTFWETSRACWNEVLRAYIEGAEKKQETIERLIAPFGEKILEQKPELVGFSCQSDQASFSLALARWLKNRSDVITVVGGYFPCFCGAEDIVRAFDFIDYACAGEGEKTLAGLAGGEPAGDIPGLVFRENGAVRRNEDAPVRELDTLPPADFSDFPLGDYFTPAPVLPVLASRGCQWGRCAFCAHRANYAKRYRQRSPGNVGTEVRRQMENTRASHFLFCDEQISGPRLERLSGELGGAGAVFGLAGLKPGREVTRERLEAARSAGCRWMYIGVESLSQRLLDLMEKGTEVEEILRVVRDCRESGITPFTSYIWGFPTQARAEVVAETVLIAENSEYLALPDDGHPFTLEKGSPVAGDPKKYKVELLGGEAMFHAGRDTVYTGRLRFRPLEGLTPLQAQAVHRPGNDLPRETHSFWECLLLLSEKGIRLTFDREEFFHEILPSVDKRLAADLTESGNLAPRPALDLALCHARLGETEKSSCLLEKLVAQELPGPALFRVMFELGKLKEKDSLWREALECHELALEKAAGAGEAEAASFHRALCLRRLGDTESAAEELLDLVSEYPVGDYAAEAHLLLGECLAACGNSEGAREHLLKSRELDPEGRLALETGFHLTAVYDKLEETRLAEEEKKKLKEIM